MLAKVISGAVAGVDGYIVEVEVDLSKGLPMWSVVGLPDAAVKEAIAKEDAHEIKTKLEEVGATVEVK